MRWTITSLIALSILVAAACGPDPSDADEGLATATEPAGQAGDAREDFANAGQLLQAEISETDLSTMYSAMDLVQFVEIHTDEPFTFFAPNDSAFSALDADDLAELLADPEALDQVLRNHYLEATVMASDLASTPSSVSTGGLELVFDTDRETPTVNGIDIVRTDLTLNNGVIHVIDGVLLDENS